MAPWCAVNARMAYTINIKYSQIEVSVWIYDQQ